MAKRTKSVAPSPALDTRVTVGSNKDVRQVVLIFGDPLAHVPIYYTFELAQARDIARMMLEHADLAEAK